MFARTSSLLPVISAVFMHGRTSKPFKCRKKPPLICGVVYGKELVLDVGIERTKEGLHNQKLVQIINVLIKLCKLIFAQDLQVYFCFFVFGKSGPNINSKSV